MGVGQDKKILSEAARSFGDCMEDIAGQAGRLRELAERVRLVWVSPSAEICAERLGLLSRRMEAVSEGLRQGAVKINAAMGDMDET